MPIKSVKMKISKNTNSFLMSQGSLNPKIRFLGQKVWPVARAQTDTQTHRVTTEGTLSGFQDFFLQPIIKDRPKTVSNMATFFAKQGKVTYLTFPINHFSRLMRAISVLCPKIGAIHWKTRMPDWQMYLPQKNYQPYRGKYHYLI